jgi:hypothetical protein
MKSTKTTKAFKFQRRARPPTYLSRQRAIVIHDEYTRTIGRFADLWGWSMVNMINRRSAIT